MFREQRGFRKAVSLAVQTADVAASPRSFFNPLAVKSLNYIHQYPRLELSLVILLADSLDSLK
jgi:hypothetical protein